MKENNVLLSEFLGWIEVGRDKSRFKATLPYYITIEEFCFDFKSTEVIDIFDTNFDSMSFNSDWNWLMLVIDKIESLSFRVRFEMETCFIMNDNFETLFSSTGHERSKIEVVYNTCIEFVKWYDKYHTVK